MKKLLIALICLLPSKLPNIILSGLGFNVSFKAKIGFSIILTPNIHLSEYSRIGHFNFIKCNEIILKPNSYVNHLNIVKGPFDLLLDIKAAIGNNNKIVRAPIGVSYRKSKLTLGELSKLTSCHYVDLTKSITFGKFSTLAGISSQIWTHGYVHEEKGAGRIRVDGEINIGDNVYIGSSCVFNPGVKIADAISVGSGSVISKDLTEKGLYVNQSLRLVKQDINKVKLKLTKLEEGMSIDNVYLKS